MRIDAYNKINQVYNNTNIKSIVKTDKPGSTDSLQLSQVGKDYQIAKQAVKNAPDIREDKVNSIKARMASGTYTISSEEIADKIIESYFSARI